MERTWDGHACVHRGTDTDTHTGCFFSSFSLRQKASAIETGVVVQDRAQDSTIQYSPAEHFTVSWNRGGVTLTDKQTGRHTNFCERLDGLDWTGLEQAGVINVAQW